MLGCHLLHGWGAAWHPLGVHQNRKCWVLYFAFTQFGPVALQKEKAWLTLLVERTVKVQELHAGVSQIFKQFFLHPGWDVGSGLLLKGPPNGINARLHIQLGAVLQDGGAHKAVFHAKRDSGTRMCFLCSNLLAFGGWWEPACMQVAQQVTTLYGQWQWHKKHHCQDQKKQCRNECGALQVISASYRVYFEPFGLLFCAELEHNIFPAS